MTTKTPGELGFAMLADVGVRPANAPLDKTIWMHYARMQ